MSGRWFGRAEFHLVAVTKDDAAKAVPLGHRPADEPKWDGFRCIVFRDGDEVGLGSAKRSPAPPATFPNSSTCSPRRSDKARSSWSPAPDSISTRCRARCARRGGGCASWPRRHPRASSPSICLPWASATSTGKPLAATAGRLHPGRPASTPPDHHDPDVAEDWFTRFEGAGFDGVMVRAGRPAVPARQEGDAQGQARTPPPTPVVAGLRWHKDSKGVGWLWLVLKCIFC